MELGITCIASHCIASDRYLYCCTWSMSRSCLLFSLLCARLIHHLVVLYDLHYYPSCLSIRAFVSRHHFPSSTLRLYLRIGPLVHNLINDPKRNSFFCSHEIIPFQSRTESLPCLFQFFSRVLAMRCVDVCEGFSYS
jgi:hypothetical protein